MPNFEIKMMKTSQIWAKNIASLPESFSCFDINPSGEKHFLIYWGLTLVLCLLEKHIFK